MCFVTRTRGINNDKERAGRFIERFEGGCEGERMNIVWTREDVGLCDVT